MAVWSFCDPQYLTNTTSDGICVKQTPLPRSQKFTGGTSTTSLLGISVQIQTTPFGQMPSHENLGTKIISDWSCNPTVAYSWPIFPAHPHIKQVPALLPKCWTAPKPLCDTTQDLTCIDQHSRFLMVTHPIVL